MGKSAFRKKGRGTNLAVRQRLKLKKAAVPSFGVGAAFLFVSFVRCTKRLPLRGQPECALPASVKWKGTPEYKRKAAVPAFLLRPKNPCAAVL